jgi:hypothetical protein
VACWQACNEVVQRNPVIADAGRTYWERVRQEHEKQGLKNGRAQTLLTAANWKARNVAEKCAPERK